MAKPQNLDTLGWELHLARRSALRPVTILISLCLLSAVGISQITIPIDPTKSPREKERERVRGQVIQPPDEREMLRENLSSEAKQLIQPSSEVKAKYKEFLRQSDTGIVKLFVSSCKGPGDVALSRSCLVGIPGNGSHYSFRERRYFYPKLADIRIEKNVLEISGFLIQGLLVEIGDVPIEGVSLASKGMNFLESYVPSDTQTGADTQWKELVAGIHFGDFTYRRSVELKSNTTYGARIIAYRSKAKTLSVDPRVDLIAVFRIAEIDSEGNPTIVWRKLKRVEAPKLTERSK